MKRKYNSAHLFEFGQFCLEKIDPLSETVPDECYTIQELMLKHIQGTMPKVQKNGMFLENASFDDDLTLMQPDVDLTDMENHRGKINDISTKLKNRAKKISELKNNAGKEPLKGGGTSVASGDPAEVASV